MEMNAQQALPVSQALAWEALNDIEMLQAAIAGCESITPTEPDHYDVAVTAAIGPVKAKFKGKLRLSDIQAPQGYVLHFEGQGGAAGHGKGQATVRLEATGENSSMLHYTVHATVGGKIAQIGSRLVDMAANKMAADFFQKLEAALVAKYPPPAAEPEASTGEAGPAAQQTGAPAEGGSLWGRATAWSRKLMN